MRANISARKIYGAGGRRGVTPGKEIPLCAARRPTGGERALSETSACTPRAFSDRRRRGENVSVSRKTDAKTVTHSAEEIAIFLFILTRSLRPRNDDCGGMARTCSRARSRYRNRRARYVLRKR